MRHRKSGRRLGRNSAHRKAMYRNMVTSLMVHGRIKTTEAKAKELRRIADRVITMGKRVPPSTLENLSGEELKAAQARRLHFIRRARRWVKIRMPSSACLVSTQSVTSGAQRLPRILVPDSGMATRRQ